jgi:hypothetical protein
MRQTIVTSIFQLDKVNRTGRLTTAPNELVSFCLLKADVEKELYLEF